MLGEFEQQLEMARRCRRVHPERAICLVQQNYALAALGRVKEIDEVLDEIEVLPNAHPDALVDIIEFMRYHGHADAAREVAERTVRWFEGRPPNEAARLNNRHEYGRALFFAGRMDEAQQVFDSIVVDFPDDVVNRTHRAFIAAMRGDTALAVSDANVLEAQADQLEGRQRDEARHWGRGVIYAALGDLDRAWELLRQFEPWWEHSAWDHVRMIYEPMRNHAEFQEMLRPKG
jgi:tetratricopeptide (TPR) repeat protein